MNLTTLEQSKKLKKWGAPQFETYFCWADLCIDHKLPNMPVFEPRIMQRTQQADIDFVSAYDLESLIEWLGKDFMRLVHQGDGSWAIWGEDGTSYCCYKTPLESVYALAEYMHLTTKV